jgi:hypothetical protein
LNNLTEKRDKKNVGEAKEGLPKDLLREHECSLWARHSNRNVEESGNDTPEEKDAEVEYHKVRG